jgi:hypothetical protein
VVTGATTTAELVISLISETDATDETELTAELTAELTYAEGAA